MLGRILGSQPQYSKGQFASGPSFHKYYDMSFLLESEQLQHIVQVMSEGLKLEYPESPQNFEITATTREGHKNFANLEELLSFENSSKTRLSSISLSVRPENRAMATLVEFKDHIPGWSVAVVVEGGGEQSSRGMFEKLKDQVRETYQWYSFLLNGRFWSSLLIACVVFILVTLLAPLFFEATSQEMNEVIQRSISTSETVSSAPEALSIPTPSRNFIIGVTIMAVVGVLLGFELIPRLFPKADFVIGQGANRSSNITVCRYIFILLLVITLIISLAKLF